ncbi:hypothetical protein [Micromonospora tarensis]|uniref:hypothetical protein n=1 Tax=Micromonospora tarensis TaxID=2806100 RepID=UPI001EE3E574|nr:hypothetical protein [Micromonospora tarensis]
MPKRPGRRPTCSPCRTALKVEQAFDDGTGTMNLALTPLANALAAKQPETVRIWLSRPHVRELLTALATGRLPLTHDGLAGHDRPIAARYLRHELMACGILPTVDKHLLDTEQWLHRRLAELVEHPHQPLLRRFALWHQLPRLRTTAAARPLRATARPYVTQQFTQAQAFLTWLHERGIAPATLTQADLDTWYATARVHQRHRVHGFLTWAITHGHLPRHLVASALMFKPGAVITQQRRLALLRRFTTDDHADVGTRTAACLLLLYAQPLSRIQDLTTADVLDHDGELSIRLGDPPAPVPEPFATLLRQLVDAAGPPPALLFPGRLAGQPVAYTTLHNRLRALGFPIKEGRVAALRQLVLQAPAPVVADALGFHPTTATRQVTNAGGTWSRYPSPRS